MTEVLFTHSYLLAYDPKEERAMMPYPPLGTLYAAAVARDAGYSVALFDAMLARSEQELEEHLMRHRPWFLVIYDDDFNYLTKMCLTRMRQASFAMSEIGKRHGCTVIVHGSDPTDHLDSYFDHGADYILIGEAERTLLELLDALTGKSASPPQAIPGVAARQRDGSIVRAPKREPLRDLDQLPMPARDLVDIERYRSVWLERHGRFSMNIVTTRGCPFHCNWCAKPLYGQVYHSHSPARIAREIEEIARLWNPDHLWFCDDIFGLRPGWVEELADEVETRGVHIPFKCLSRADLLQRDETVDALRRAGCTTIWIGAESGSQAVLDAMEKGTTVEQIDIATEKLRAAGIRVGFFLQFGYPGEGAREIDETLRMVRRARPDEIGISVSYPLPGTRFHERVRAEMGEKQNWSESADLAMMFRGAYSTEFYRVLARYVHMDHRLAQGEHALRQLLHDHQLPTRAAARRIALSPYYLAHRTLLSFRMKKLRIPRTSQPAIRSSSPITIDLPVERT
jgi:radical SAM superfamily enzyme YgiQ (UPF0313 family)